MSKRKRTLLIITSIIVSTIIIVSFFANSILENKIEALIKDKLPSHIESTHKNISVNILSGSITINKPILIIKTKDSLLVQSNIKMKSLNIGGISYWDYFMNNEIHIGKIKFNQLAIIHFKDRKNPKADSTLKKPIELPKDIIINTIDINNTSLTIIENKKDSTLLSLSNTSIIIEDILLNEETITQKLPITYKSIYAETDSIFYKAGKFENLTVRNLKIKDNSLSLKGLHFKTKFSKSELSRIIKTERDHIDIKLKELSINKFDFGGLDNDSLFVSTNLIIVDQAIAKFHRNKLVNDDLRIKPLYSKSIRNLPFKLTVDSISIINSLVKYSEKVHTENPDGVLTITNINAGVSNISNTYQSPDRTKIIADAIFMKNTPIQVDWSFDVNKTNDSFIFKGHAGKLNASDMNDYLTPLLNIELKGEIIESIFTITGDYNQSEIKLSQDYLDIELVILNKKKSRNKFLSSIANTFIHKDSEKEKEHYFHNITTQATRDKTKSFFNYLAKNLIAGLFVNFTHKNNTVTKPKEKKKNRKKRSKKN